MNDDAEPVIRLNECISTRDVEGLAALMSQDHSIVDTAGAAVLGRSACIDAWRGFFLAYPGYRNVFEAFSANGEAVTVSGHSLCPGHPELEGPALWLAIVRGGQLSEWRVYEDTPEARRELGL